MAREDTGPRWPASVALVVVIATPALLLYAWSRPNPTPPLEIPPLTLAPDEVAEARAAMAALTEPTGETAEARRAVFREVNVAEHEANDYPGQARLRRQRLIAATRAVVEEHGDGALAAMRAADVERGMRALSGHGAPDEAVAEVGAFLRMMDRYAMAAGGRQTAPDFVVRTALMARWNAVHDLELTDGLSPVQRRAYWGWLALHAGNAPIELRRSALDRYAEAGGARVDEARGVLAYEEGDLDEAHVAFERAHARRGGFRLRNLTLGALDRIE